MAVGSLTQHKMKGLIFVLLLAVLSVRAQKWPSKCRGKAGMTMTSIKNLLGTGGAGPVALGNMTFLQRYKECNDFTGCGEWTFGWSAPSWPIDWKTKKPPKTTTPQLVMQVYKNQLMLDFVAPYVRGSSQCVSGKVKFGADITTNITFSEVDVGYLDSSGGFGCQPRRFKENPAGSSNAQTYPFVGVVTNTCAQFGSGEMRYQTSSGYGVYQSILFSSWQRP